MMPPLSLKLYIFSSSLSKFFAIKVFWIFKFAKFSGFHMSHHHNLSMRFHLPQGRFFLCISICTMPFKILLQLKILTMTMWKYRASETSSGVISFWIFFFYFFKNSRDQLIFFFFKRMFHMIFPHFCTFWENFEQCADTQVYWIMQEEKVEAHYLCVCMTNLFKTSLCPSFGDITRKLLYLLLISYVGLFAILK